MPTVIYFSGMLCYVTHQEAKQVYKPAPSVFYTVCPPYSSSQCSSGSSLLSSSWPAFPRLWPQLRSQLLHYVGLPYLLAPAPQTQAAQMCPSQTRASSPPANSRQRSRTASWAVGRRTLWRRCERWHRWLRFTVAVLLVGWTVQTAACWSNTCPLCSRGRRRQRRERPVIEQKHLSRPHPSPRTKQHSLTRPHRTTRQQTINQRLSASRKPLPTLSECLRSISTCTGLRLHIKHWL